MPSSWRSRRKFFSNSANTPRRSRLPQLVSAKATIAELLIKLDQVIAAVHKENFGLGVDR
jgi:hypothetical protein